MTPACVLRVLRLGPRAILRKLVCRAQRRMREVRDRVRPTYGVPRRAGRPLALLAAAPSAGMAPSEIELRALELMLEHRTDVLGLRWQRMAHGAAPAGFPPGLGVPLPGDRGAPATVINRANRRRACELRALIDQPWEPVDWQRDHRSGFRWRSDRWHGRIRYGGQLAVDVKVPWEVARLQHLTALAAAAGSAVAPSLAERLAREVRNQTLDFLASNPPGYGVAWACTMDVAIRAANLAFAWDLLVAAGHTPDPEYADAVERALREHGEHIIDNLEWEGEVRGNHYLADVCGLLVAAAHLVADAQSDAWLAFAADELLRCAREQFCRDGACFEGSTSYHRLSTEMLIHGTSVLLAIDGSRYRRGCTTARTLRRLPRHPQGLVGVAGDGSTLLPDWLGALLVDAARFTAAVTRPDGRIVQFGDNDSGRFVKTFPTWGRHEDGSPAEDVLDHRHLRAAIAALVPSVADVTSPDAVCQRERQLVAGIARGRQLPCGSVARRDLRADEEVFRASQAATSRMAAPGPRVTRFDGGAGLRRDLVVETFPEGGVYVFRSARIYLAVRCGPIGQRGVGGHDHDDQLAIELVIDGKDLAIDPGTFCYTPIPALRNRYRSAAAHFAPRAAGASDTRLADGLFRLAGALPGSCRYAGGLGFLGSRGDGPSAVHRRIELEDDAVLVIDWCEDLGPLAPVVDPPAFSPGYGMLEST